MKKMEVGQTVFVESTTPIECIITKVGNKYFNIGDKSKNVRFPNRFLISTMMEDNPGWCVYRYRVYLTEKELSDKYELPTVLGRINKILQTDYSVDELKRLEKRLEKTRHFWEDMPVQWVKWTREQPTWNGSVYVQFNGKNQGMGIVHDRKLVKLEGLSTELIPKYEDSLYWLKQDFDYYQLAKDYDN